MKRVLVPIDFSNDSINAFEHAIILCNMLDAKLRLVHVIKGKQFDPPENILHLEKIVNKDVDEYFNALLQKYEDKINVNIDYVVREGKVYKEITDQARFDNSSMIIIGTHGVSGFEELWLGSNAFRVVTNSPCPVITIRNGFLRKGIRKIVLPVDITKETRMKVPFTADIAVAFNAEVHVVAVCETDRKKVIERTEKYSDQAKEYLENRGLMVHQTSLFGSNITDISIEYAISVKAELISIMTEQPKNAKNLFLGPYAQQMVNHSPIPVLSLNANNF